jgi:1-hydroxycarotenoid 3,4-desaturase
MRTERVVIVGAGVAGLSSALALAARGLDVTVLERAATPGGKIRQIGFGSSQIDSGPTVFTMRWVFEELFADAGETFSEWLRVKPLHVLARHAWNEDNRLDLFADQARSEDAIGDFAGAAEADRFRKFCADSRRIYEILEKPFLCASQPSLGALLGSNGLRGLVDLPHIKPFTTMWNALGKYFHDPRLRQLFGRYATYCGSSPFDAPATLMLVAHVEREGVWSIEGGMFALARALANCATKLGAKIRYESDVREVLTSSGKTCGVALASGERVAADAVIMNCDVSAVATGLFGESASGGASAIPRKARSLSAMTWSMKAKTGGFPLAHHSVFFSQDYRAEFDDIFRRGTIPTDPTVYICAQDRSDDDAHTNIVRGEERLLVLANAPPNGDRYAYDNFEVERYTARTLGVLQRCGLQIDRRTDTTHVTTPRDFNEMFPATGGALYGRSSHGWMASFQRPGTRTKVSGLYLTGGSVHPGPGVPMASLSGRAAAKSVADDFERASSRRNSGFPRAIVKSGTTA